MNMQIKIGDTILTSENDNANVVEIDIHTIAPDKLIKFRIGKNVYVWIKESQIANIKKAEKGK